LLERSDLACPFIWYLVEGGFGSSNAKAAILLNDLPLESEVMEDVNELLSADSEGRARVRRGPPVWCPAGACGRCPAGLLLWRMLCGFREEVVSFLDLDLRFLVEALPSPLLRELLLRSDGCEVSRSELALWDLVPGFCNEERDVLKSELDLEPVFCNEECDALKSELDRLEGRLLLDPMEGEPTDCWLLPLVRAGRGSVD